MNMDSKKLSDVQMKAEFMKIKIDNLKQIEFERQLNQKNQKYQNMLVSPFRKFYNY